MGFTTQTFLFFFFPLSILGYIIFEFAERLKIDIFRKIRAKDLALIIISLCFYAWAGLSDTLVMIVYTLAIHVLAKWIETSKTHILVEKNIAQTDKKPRKTHIIPLVISLILIISYLAILKYASVSINTFNQIFQTKITLALLAPLGLSFITFSSISYIVDTYRGDAKAGTIVDCALYILFFPKIVSGPIVLWKDFNAQSSSRTMTLDNATRGITRVMMGFIKKLILADTFGSVLADIGANSIDQITAFGSIILYFLQIYYDFSGYSDIAIGLSSLFGFDVDENFNFPYRATSITQFWRRWHISLGKWFKEYVYIPLGGNKCGLKRTLLNLFIVFILTGIWHGAGWNYLLWGIINAVIVVIERLLFNSKFYQKTPTFIKWMLTTITLLCLWQIFRFEDISSASNVFTALFGKAQNESINYTWQYYFDKQTILLSIIGFLGATVLGNAKIDGFFKKIAKTKTGYSIMLAFLVIGFVVSIFFMVNSTYSPFIYFRY